MAHEAHRDSREPPEATRTSVDSSLRLAPGSVLSGRYRVLALLGIGAMGMVYRARDEDLGVDIALKVLRPELSHQAGLLERFRRELILARQVSHRHVVRIHDIGRDGDLYFLSMDLVPGRSLRELLEERGALPPGEVEALGGQIAAALAAAHEQGVVHRDLKPSNILIGEDDRAYVTDFGVARSVTAGGLTGTGAVVGTPDYLSPEQALGQPVDARSDVYAFGIVLFEMLTGDLPFASGSLAESVAQRVAGPPRKLRERGDYAPAWLRAVVARCLERRPSRRYASGAEVRAALEAQRAPATRRWSALAGGAVLLLAVGTGLVIWKKEAASSLDPEGAGAARQEAAGVGRDAVPASSRRLVLLPLVDQTGRPELAWLAAGLPEHLAEQLGEDPRVLVVDAARVLRTLGDLRLGPGPWSEAALQQLSELFDADRIVVGALRSTSDSMSVEFELRRPGGGDSIQRLSVPAVALGRPQDLLTVAGAELRRALAAGDVRPRALTARPEALESYSRGASLLATGDALGARPLLAAAVELDPAFGVGWLRLSEALASLGLGAEAGEAAARAVTELSGSPGRLSLEARAHQARLAGEPERAQEILRQLVDAYPGDIESRLALGEAYGEEGRLEEAMATLEESVALAPSHPKAWFLLGKYAIRSGDPKRAVEELLVRGLVMQKRLHNEQGQADVLNAFGIAYRDLGELELAAENFTQAAALRETIGDRRGYAGTLRNLAQIHIARGEYSPAEENLRRAMAIRQEIGDPLGVAALENDLGVLEEDRGRYADALEHYRRALQQRRDLGNQAAVAESLNNVGFAFYLLGQFDNATVYWSEAAEIYDDVGNPVGSIRVQQSLAQLELARGQWDAAARSSLDALERSREVDVPPAIAAAHGSLGRLAHCQGRMAAALGSYGEALTRLESLEDLRGLTEFTLARAETLLALGKLDAARDDLARAAAWLERSANHEQSAELLRLQAEQQARSQGGPVARQLELAVREAAASGSAILPLSVALAVGEEELRRERFAEASRRARAVLERAVEIGHVPMQLRSRELLAASELGAGRPAEAEAVLAEARATVGHLGSYWRNPQLLELEARLSEAGGRGQEAEELRRQAAAEWERARAGVEGASSLPQGPAGEVG